MKHTVESLNSRLSAIRTRVKALEARADIVTRLDVEQLVKYVDQHLADLERTGNLFDAGLAYALAQKATRKLERACR